MYVKYQKSTYLKWTSRLYCQNERVAKFSTLYLTVSGIIILSLKSTKLIQHTLINKKKPKTIILKIEIPTFW